MRNSIWPLIIAITLAAVTTAAPREAAALETDQFTVPPAPLADIGPELAAEVVARIDTAVARVNARAASHARRADAARGFWRRHHLRELDKQLAEATLAREVYRELAGPWLPECRIERWLRTHRFERGPARFEMNPAGGAYGPSPLARSPLLMSLSPTVNTFGVYCGADKVGHLFQQGYQYYERFARAEARAMRLDRRGRKVGRESRGRDNSRDGLHDAHDHAAALADAVRRGIDQERGLFGLKLVGVYSNADLAANYAGLKLYLNLTRAVRVGKRTRPPLFVLRDGQWAQNPDAAPSLGEALRSEATAAQGATTPAEPTSRAVAFLRPFVSDHFNEALNPSRYSRPTRDTVRARWRKRGPAWAAFYGSTRKSEVVRLVRLATWHGEPYGHSGFDNLVTALDTCFDGDDNGRGGQARDARNEPTPKPRLAGTAAAGAEQDG